MYSPRLVFRGAPGEAVPGVDVAGTDWAEWHATMGGAQGPGVHTGQHSVVAARHTLGLRRSGQDDSTGERDQQKAHGKIQDKPNGTAQPEHVAEGDR